MLAAPWRPWAAVLTLVCALGLAGCGGSSDAHDTPTAGAGDTATATALVGTPSPSGPDPTGPTGTATREPAPAGGPPAASFEVAFPGLPALEKPVQMIEVPGQRWMIVALQQGRILGFPKDGPYSEPTTVYDRRAATAATGNELGLLSIALDPAFEENAYFYVYYSASGAQLTTRLSRFRTTGSGPTLRADESSELVILEVRQPFANHNGGTIAFGPDGMLYLGLGDGGSGGDPRGFGQDRSSLLGSIIRLDVREASAAEPYRVPPDNPFVGVTGMRPEIWAYGFRNPWRMSFDPETGLLWAGDVGQNRFEEVNVVHAGGNHGWNIMEGSACFEPQSGCDTAGLELPVAEYGIAGSRECAVTGGVVYHGTAIPSLRGYYLYADYCSGRAWALHAATAAAGERAEPIVLWPSGPTIPSLAVDADGKLYFLSFDGQIYRVIAAE